MRNLSIRALLIPHLLSIIFEDKKLDSNTYGTAPTKVEKQPPPAHALYLVPLVHGRVYLSPFICSPFDTLLEKQGLVGCG